MGWRDGGGCGGRVRVRDGVRLGICARIRIRSRSWVSVMGGARMAMVQSACGPSGTGPGPGFLCSFLHIVGGGGGESARVVNLLPVEMG